VYEEKSMKIDYYKVLGVARDANANDIKQAFRKLALEFHPDRHAQSSIQSQESAGRRFRQVSEAYEVLSDNLKRIAYNKGTHYAGSQAGPTSRLAILSYLMPAFISHSILSNLEIFLF
jgi:DnaJ-class molecular chaperone